ncbi:DUF6443 domain-containing protein [Lunatibacter salilacus]|uniref:DUF6443 domain-containing protein n=1 Tax=Lunatibacter salilacus TaxID=2483804 RepID=UPI0018FEDAAF|nr:DUF6443 domain-containing protein [Lunatibacter salilacus]
MKKFLIIVSLLLSGKLDVPQAIAQQKENYVYRYHAKEPLKNIQDLVTGSSTQSTKSVTYYDGLGRPKQTIHQQSSAAGWDLIQPIQYDAAGRQTRDYLPYARNNGAQSGNFRSTAPSEHAAYFSSQYSGDGHGYSETQYEFSSLGKADKKGSPGNQWRIGSGREVILIERPNRPDESVRKWEVNADGLPSTSDTYKEGDLWVKETVNENKTKTVEYTDHLGNVVLRKVQISNSPSSHHAGWLSTYYVYDAFVDLRVVIPPKAVAFLTNNWAASTQIQLADEQYYRYRYDNRKRIIEKKIPGKGWEYMLYDEKDRLVGTQDANLRSKNQWHYRLYDVYNREIVQGIVVDGRDRSQIQQRLGTMTPVDFEVDYFKGLISNGTLTNASANRTIPGINSGFPMQIGEMLLLNFYDHYDFNSLGNYTRLSIIHAISSNSVQGLQTGGLKRNLQTGKFLEATFFYDKDGLLIQQISENHMGGLIRQSTAYNFEKKPISVTPQLLGPTNLNVTKGIDYFPNGAIRQTTHRIGWGQTIQLVNFQYSQTGELIQKRVHNSLANLDFRYNIRGWLTQINEAKGSNRLFGMQLYYESGADVNNWNGNISRVDWKGRDLVSRSYDYRYDLADRITQASYAVPGTPAQKGRYSLSGLTYDPNGNLLRLVRNNQQTETLFTTVDNLSFNYLPHSNRISKVTDTHTNKNYLAHDFKPGGSVASYSYDGNGNLKSNGDKQIREITYNFLNLPTEITFESGERLIFTYAADGTKLRQEFKPTSGPSKIIDYIGEFVFEDGKLDYIVHDEGRAVLENNTYHYEYYIKDHLGNVRQVIRPQVTETLLATMELNRSTVEEKEFERVRESRQSGAEHNVTPGGNNIAWLNASRGRILGPAWEREVQEGQELSLSVYGKYRDKGNLKVSPLVFVSSGAKAKLVTQLGELSNTTKLSAVPNAVTILSVIDLLIKEVQAKPSPEAYMMYALYDKSGKLYAQGKKALSTKAAGKHEYLTENIYISKDGKMEAFLVNETAEDVWFDDFEVQSKTPLIVQESHYDPWGVQLSGLGYQYKGFKENRYLYNGKEHIADKQLAWYDYGARMYDPAVGRWWVVDPLADQMRRHSPYNYAFNNPLRFIDPDGMAPCESCPELDFIKTQLESQYSYIISNIEKAYKDFNRKVDEVGKNVSGFFKELDEKFSSGGSGNVHVSDVFSGDDSKVREGRVDAVINVDDFILPNLRTGPAKNSAEGFLQGVEMGTIIMGFGKDLMEGNLDSTYISGSGNNHSDGTVSVDVIIGKDTFSLRTKNINETIRLRDDPNVKWSKNRQ